MDILIINSAVAMRIFNESAKEKFLEEGTLFFSILKWSIFATLIGALVGFSTTIFLKSLNFLSEKVATFNDNFLLLPVIFILCSFLVKYLAPEAEGHGTEKVIEAVHKRSGRISIAVIPVKLVASIITIAFGGSAGKEGPCAQIGAGISSFVADLFKMSDTDRRKIVICGISGGFSSVFGTPIAGALFGIEVLFIGQMLYDVLLPSFISGLVAYHIASNLGIVYMHHSINTIPLLDQRIFFETIVAGVFFGIISLIFIEMLQSTEHLVDRYLSSTIKKGLIGGLLVAGIGFFVSPEYIGLGANTIEKLIQGKEYPFYAFFMKALATSITLNSGGSGGIITPIFFVGASAGNLFARLFNLDPSVFSAIGLVSLLAGCANTPISASILAIELFGARIGPYAALSCIVSFIMVGHRSVYPSQKIGIRKSASIRIELNEEVEDVKNIEVELRKEGILKLLIYFSIWLENTLKNLRAKLIRLLEKK